MVTIVPIAIFVGATATAALAFFAFWETVQRGAMDRMGKFTKNLDTTGMGAKTDEMVITWITISAGLWILLLLLLKPGLLVGLLLLPVTAAAGAGVFSLILQMRVRGRTEAFLNQLETVLRLMASGLRSGLGLQQTLNLVIDEAKDPARTEFARVLGQTNIGASVYDALDDLASRIKANETLMMARVIRINGQTGGDLGRVLEQLANTIKERRRMRRKVKSLTAEGRAGAAVLGALPIFLGGFIVMTQPEMNHGLLFTPTGHVVLLIVLILEALGIFALNRILQVNV
ncbi:MAG TPA: type II secretion system F family protein [Candidatus Baltobacteraceae bacterium]|nr:type II secretion system F family protein [Candidatus Baltobacteraceae bacterium]